MKKSYFGELTAEFLGTALLIVLGDGVVATAVLHGAYQGQWQPSILWGLTVMGLVFVFGGVSGAHFNPAVTLTVGFFRDFPKHKILPFITAQVAGAFSGAALLYLMIGSKLATVEAAKGIIRTSAGGSATAMIFTDFPGADVPIFSAFLFEVVLTMVLLLVILAIGDNRQAGAPKNGLGPVVVGATVALLVGIGGPWTMAAINPARDFGPRLFAFIAGWGQTALPGPNFYFWVPIVGPILGGVLAGVIYELVLRKHLPAAADEKKAA